MWTDYRWCCASRAEEVVAHVVGPQLLWSALTVFVFSSGLRTVLCSIVQVPSLAADVAREAREQIIKHTTCPTPVDTS